MNTAIAIVYANLKGNLGDFAILHAMLSDIESKYPDCTVDVYSHGFVSVDYERLAAFRKFVPAFRHAGTTFVDDVRPNWLTKLFLRITRFTATYQGSRITALASKASLEAKTFSRYHAVYLAGGAQWTGERSGVSMFATLRAISEHNDHIFSYPVSVTSSLRKVNDQQNLRRDLTRIHAPIIARDSSSEKMLRELGLDVVLGSDCVFTLARAGEEVVPARNLARPRVLLVVTGQDARSLKNAVSLLRSADISYAFMTTCEMEDAPAQRPIADAAGIDFLSPLTWQDAVAEMKASTLVVTNRLHGLILASFSSVPVLPLMSRPKVRAVVEDMGLPLSISDLGDLNVGVVKQAMDRRTDIVEKISRYRDFAQSKVRGPIS